MEGRREVLQTACSMRALPMRVPRCAAIASVPVRQLTSCLYMRSASLPGARSQHGSERVLELRAPACGRAGEDDVEDALERGRALAVGLRRLVPVRLGVKDRRDDERERCRAGEGNGDRLAETGAGSSARPRRRANPLRTP